MNSKIVASWSFPKRRISDHAQGGRVMSDAGAFIHAMCKRRTHLHGVEVLHEPRAQVQAGEHSDARALVELSADERADLRREQAPRDLRNRALVVVLCITDLRLGANIKSCGIVVAIVMLFLLQLSIVVCS